MNGYDGIMIVYSPVNLVKMIFPAINLQFQVICQYFIWTIQWECLIWVGEINCSPNGSLGGVASTCTYPKHAKTI